MSQMLLTFAFYNIIKHFDLIFMEISYLAILPLFFDIFKNMHLFDLSLDLFHLINILAHISFFINEVINCMVIYC